MTSTEEREPDVAIRWRRMDHAEVQAHLEATIGDFRPSVMLDRDCRWGRSHLRLHKDGAGYFVRQGRRGSSKHYLSRCKITYLDRAPTLYQFSTAGHDRFVADQEKRLLERDGMGDLFADWCKRQAIEVS